MELLLTGRLRTDTRAHSSLVASRRDIPKDDFETFYTVQTDYCTERCRRSELAKYGIDNYNYSAVKGMRLLT